jgi:hypothetical protein
VIDRRGSAVEQRCDASGGDHRHRFVALGLDASLLPYITPAQSAISSITPKLWLMNSTVKPLRLRKSRISCKATGIGPSCSQKSPVAARYFRQGRGKDPAGRRSLMHGLKSAFAACGLALLAAIPVAAVAGARSALVRLIGECRLWSPTWRAGHAWASGRHRPGQ